MFKKQQDKSDPFVRDVARYTPEPTDTEPADYAAGLIRLYETIRHNQPGRSAFNIVATLPPQVNNWYFIGQMVEKWLTADPKRQLHRFCYFAYEDLTILSFIHKPAG